MGVGGQLHAPAALPPGKTRYPLYRRLGGPHGRSGRIRKISPPPGIDPRTVQPVASRYTDYAIPAPRPTTKQPQNKLTSGSAFSTQNADGMYTSSNFMPMESSSVTISISFSTLIISVFCCKIISKRYVLNGLFLVFSAHTT